MAKLKDRVVIVTGAAQGIGAAYAKALAAEGAKVAACDILPCDTTAAAIRQAGGEGFGARVDVTSAESVMQFVAEIDKRYGAIHGLVNNAAIFKGLAHRRIEDISSAEFDRVMAVNVRGCFECIKAVLPVMKRQGYGKIVNISSGTVFRGSPLLTDYVTSKGAVIALTRCVAREVGEFGIRVNCIAPGLTLSEAVRDDENWTSGSWISEVTNTRALKRDQQPDDLTGTAVFLIAPESDFITGQTLVVDGGGMMH